MTAQSSPVEPGFFTDKEFIYKFLPADSSIGNVAARFGVEPSAICRLNEETSNWTPAPGTPIRVPRPRETQDFIPPGSTWAPYEVPDDSIKLTDLLNRLSKAMQLASTPGAGDAGSPGSGNVDPADALSIWRYWRNAVLRETVLQRTPAAAGPPDGLAQFSVDGAAQGVALPAKDVVEQFGTDAAILTKDDTVFLPLTPMIQRHVAVAPNAPATVDLTVTPLEHVRRRLGAILALHEILIGVRALAQTIQSECTEDIRVLYKLRTLVHAEQQQFATQATLHHDDESRGALLRAVDALIAKAPQYMLKSPHTTIDPTIGTRWKGAIGQLRRELKKEDLRQLLDQVLPRSGEVVCVLDGVQDRRNFVETLCVVAARSAYWLGQSGAKDDKDLLLDAMTTLTQARKGSTPTANGTKSLLGYAALLAGAGNDLSLSCGGPATVAYCGALTSAYAIAALGDPRGSADQCLQNLRDAISSTIELDVDAYVEAERREKKVNESLWKKGSAIYEQVSEIGESREKVAPAETAEEIEEKETHASLTSAMPSLDERRRQFANPQLHLGTFPSRMGELYLLIGLICGMVRAGGAAYSTSQAKSDSERLVGLAKTAQTGFEVAQEAIESMKKLGILEEAAGAELSPLFGQAALLIGAMLQFVEGQEAFEAGKEIEGCGHLGEGFGMTLMFGGSVASAPVFVAIGTVVLVVGVVVAASGQFPDLFKSGPRAAFEANFARFKRYGSRFAALTDDIASVEDRLKHVDLPPLDSMQYDAYRYILEPAGFTTEELAH